MFDVIAATTPPKVKFCDVVVSIENVVGLPVEVENELAVATLFDTCALATPLFLMILLI